MGGNQFEEGGSGWMTRSLNIMALPEAQVNIVNPRWKFKLNSADIWSEWQGFEQELEFDYAVPVFALYSTVCNGKNTMLTSRMTVGGHEKKVSRSVAGNTAIAQNTGFFVDRMPA